MPKKTRKPTFQARMKHAAERRDLDTGKLVPTRLRDWEMADIITLYRAGHAVSEIAALVQRSEPSVRRVLLDERQRAEGELADEYLANHRLASKVAAAAGNAAPSMDMLDRMGVVPAASRDRLRLEGQRIKAGTAAAARQPAAGPTINIGIGLPGVLPASSGKPAADAGQVVASYTLPNA